MRAQNVRGTLPLSVCRWSSEPCRSANPRQRHLIDSMWEVPEELCDSDGQKIPLLLWNPTAHYCVRQS
jgi:hypothetical protein